MPLAWGDIEGVSNDSRYAMRTSAKRVELLPPEPRPAYRTLEGWAMGTFIEHGAVRECERHGHMRPDLRRQPRIVYAARKKHR